MLVLTKINNMNLVAYDTLNTHINTKKTWIKVSKKLIISKEIKYRKYVSFGKRYDNEENKTIFFIIFLDDPPLDRAYSNMIMDDSGRTKISIKNIWNELGLCNLTNDINIGVKHTQNADDGDIYELVIN